MNEVTQSVCDAECRPDALNVLVAEDNQVNRLLARKALTNVGHKVVLAENGQVAVDLLLKHESGFDLILMDCQMPIMDGFQATARIRELQSSGRIRPLPIVAVTAMDMHLPSNGILPAGFDNYLVKPYSTTDLIRVVEQQATAADAGSPELLQQPTINSGDLPFDIDVLLNACHGDTDMAEHLIEVFRQNADESLARIRNGGQTGDLATIQATAHSLKGAAGMLGANFVWRLAIRLEEIVELNADLNRLVEELSEEIERCRGFQLAIV